MNDYPEATHGPIEDVIMWEEGYGSWLEVIFDPDDPYGIDRLEDLEI